jgi:hypothetical protein
MQFTPDRERETYGRVEMCARDRSKDQNEHREDSAGRDGIAKQGKCHVPARELLRHDPGANYSGKQKSGAEPL